MYVIYGPYMAMLNEQNIRKLLGQVASGEQDVEEALACLRTLPFEDLGFAKLDHHREIRRGFPETIYCAGKTAEQVAEIAVRLAQCGTRLLGTRATPEQFQAARRRVCDLEFDSTARAIWLDREPSRPRKPGIVLLAAGTSDLPVAEEAALTLDLAGHAVRRIYDIGIAGLHACWPTSMSFERQTSSSSAPGWKGLCPASLPA